MTAAPYSIDDLLTQMTALDASDLHITPGVEPVVRIRGDLARLDGFDKLTPDATRELVYRIMTTEQQKVLETRRSVDLAYTLPGVARFRVNVYFQRASVGAAFRMIPTEIKPLEELGLPTQLADLATKPRGLVLVTGPTGSGKSTTLATLIDLINRTRSDHILTIEDPIEFLHWHRKCIVNQREIGPDATSFADALRSALRQDPDVILVGEMRDLETISTALTAAETGHLVFATLHTQSAPTTIDRIIDVFPAEQQDQVRIQLASTIQGVVTQTLLPTADGRGRVAALEILIPDDAVRNLIRQGKVEQIYSVMQTGTGRGMQTM
jgi:twitching motility protein PilT